ncbi:MAG: 4-(cytidine 5'-diphospho)-2-C-methyl-D-erythritol kinase [Lentisphaeria bacterium]|nr:4-(cytidine 5'-diphospho)-2-C-methyl-D-erythritol kinase [Lentisphaeria bacterium]
MIIQAPAKTNLYLAVTGKRPDGYHDLVSLFVHLHGLHDTLTVTPRQPDEGLSLTCDQSEIPRDSRNLAWRAAEILCRELGLKADWHIDLVKRIPAAAGLGGGSSDAAAVMKAILAIENQHISAERLNGIAAGLGADVPFFLQDQPCFATGIGEKLTPVHCGTPIPVMLVNAGFPISTAWAYAHVTPANHATPPAILDYFSKGDIRHVAESTYNAFEEDVYRKFPILEMIRDTAAEQGVLTTRLSGSGSTQFMLFTDTETPEKVIKSLKQKLGFTPWTWVGQIHATK